MRIFNWRAEGKLPPIGKAKPGEPHDDLANPPLKIKNRFRALGIYSSLSPTLNPKPTFRYFVHNAETGEDVAGFYTLEEAEFFVHAFPAAVWGAPFPPKIAEWLEKQKRELKS
jgi:hypothetical protein